MTRPAAVLRLALPIAFALAAPAAAREAVRIAGSDLVLPYAAAAAETVPEDPPPVVTPMTGEAAFRAFCSGVGETTPDAVAALRPMTDAETKACTGAGVVAITDLPFGRDALVLAGAADGPVFDLTRATLFTALAAKVLVDGQLVANPYGRWSEIDARLPDRPIRVIGPAPGSDAAAAFAALFLEPGCRSFAALADLPPEVGDVCRRLRDDGALVPGTGGAAAALAAVDREPGSLAFATYGAVARAGGRHRLASVDTIAPDETSIAAGRYAGGLDLHLVVKNAHRALDPAFDRFVRAFVSEGTLGPGGALTTAGFVPASADRRGLMRRDVDAAAPPPR